MRGWFAAVLAVVALAGGAAGAQPARAPVEISISCGALGVELQLCTDAVHRWEKKTGNRVRIVSTPNSSTDRLALYLQMLASRTDEFDVLQIDVVWAGILADHLIDLRPYLGDAPKAHFASLIRNDTVNGRLVAMPWWTDVGVLYYRKDLLAEYGFAPPQTWQEMTRIARAIQAAERAKGHTRMWGYVFQGRAYEGLTCNALEWIDSFNGGAIVDAKGDITVDNPRAIEALSLAGSWVGTISPRGVLNYDEEAARGVFQTGDAVFMRNWPYAWALAQGQDSPVRGKVGVVPLPKGGPGGKHAGTLGGWHLAVSRYSKHPAEAASLVAFLTSAPEQKIRAVKAAYNPTIPALYGDPDVLAANPFFGALLPSLESATARPSRVAGPHYNRLSSDFWRAVHDVLTGDPAGPRVAELNSDLDRLKYRARW
ncbi:ABC transporter substrate-binding protein [Phenylobacterium sp.]|uniref:ABC transporter substrate-binding protein n=1 Tax=Phenylobacterium sp. TaxID=1871053 RepID=UPI0035AEFC4F